MIAAMLAIPVVDGLAKYLSADYSPLFLSWARYAVASVVVLPVAGARHGRHLFPAERRGWHLLRTVFLVTSMTLHFLAVARIPLATADSTYFVGPIIAVVLAIAVLKERRTARKALSLAPGFVGSMVILRPGGAMDPGILPALGSGIAFARYLIATRQAAQDSDPVKTLLFQYVVGTALLTPQAMLTWSVPAWHDLLFFVALGLLSAISLRPDVRGLRRAAREHRVYASVPERARPCRSLLSGRCILGGMARLAERHAGQYRPRPCPASGGGGSPGEERAPCRLPFRIMIIRDNHSVLWRSTI